MTAQGFLAFKARLKQDFGKVMARFVLYTGLVVGDAGIAITALPHGKRGNKYERLFDRNKTTDKNLLARTESCEDT